MDNALTDSLLGGSWRSRHFRLWILTNAPGGGFAELEPEKLLTNKPTTQTLNHDK